MKIAEALALRADLQRRLEQLKQRLVKNARIQEGDKPEEDPVELQSELERSAQELTVIIQRINRTNAAARLGDSPGRAAAFLSVVAVSCIQWPACVAGLVTMSDGET